MATEKPKLAKIFDGRDGTELNALWTAMIECGKDYARETSLEPDEKSVYDWLRYTPRTTLVVQTVDKLHELGYEIRAKIEERNSL